jgi:hypothetical protein
MNHSRLFTFTLEALSDFVEIASAADIPLLIIVDIASSSSLVYRFVESAVSFMTLRENCLGKQSHCSTWNGSVPSSRRIPSNTSFGFDLHPSTVLSVQSSCPEQHCPLSVLLQVWLFVLLLWSIIERSCSGHRVVPQQALLSSHIPAIAQILGLLPLYVATIEVFLQ